MNTLHDSAVKPDYITQLFDSDGLLSKQFEGYQPRPGQITLARAIDQAVQTGGRVLVEAPTGTGKSFGYLVPAAYHLTVGADDLLASRATVSDEDGFDPEDDADLVPPPRAVIATANIALQEQLIGKDVPRLQKIVPWEFTAAIAKGRANYLCLHRFDESCGDVLLDPIRDYEDRERWNMLAKWRTETKTGDLSELTFELSSNLKAKAAVSADDCLGKACSRIDECFSQKARLAVQNADLIVTNYHMLCSHLAFINEFGRGILPRFDILVLDEAHALPDVARDFFGFKVTGGAIAYAVRLMSSSKWKGSCPFKPQLREDLMRAADEFFQDLVAYKNGPVYYGRLKESDPVDGSRLVALLEQARDAQVGVASSNVDPERAEQLRRAARKCRIHAENIRRAMKNEDTGKDVNEVFFIEEHGKGVALCCKPVKVAGILKSTIWEALSIRAVVATSATLAADNSTDALGYFADEVGADNAEQLVVESPFRFDEQALLVIPNGLPDPKDKTFSEQIAHVIADVVAQADGRTLVLCTSHRTLGFVYDVIEKRFGHVYKILRQGQAPRMQLIEEFKRDVSSVLVGTKSFWEGVDVPGESLSCTVIDKIPFDSPDDPINDAMSEILGQKAFRQYAMPRASIALRQGFGRLIRSSTDRGVVVMCDKRLIEQPFGKTILKALPKTRMSRDITDIRAFLAGRTVDERKEPSSPFAPHIDAGLRDVLNRGRR
jgi:ATP-dependent DNA helicase DinG